MTAVLTAVASIFFLFLLVRSERAAAFRLVLRAMHLRERGESAAAAALLSEALPQGRAFPNLVNLLVETLITAGKYREALAVPTSFIDGGPFDQLHIALVHINLAEAEYNLGLWGAAWSRLERLDGPAAPFAITRAGLALQRAWILAHTNRPWEALSNWEQADVGGLPYNYRAEHCFTHAAVLLALGRLEDAGEAAAAGADATVRPSSARNALFLLARVAAARGEWDRADALCSEAADHGYRGQGGDGLLLWGDALCRLGRRVEARRAYALCIERDGQSESATTAGERLRAMDPESSTGT